MAKYRECKHYQAINEEKGSCFGIEIEGDRDPQDSKECQGKYFEPKE